MLRSLVRLASLVAPAALAMLVSAPAARADHVVVDFETTVTIYTPVGTTGSMLGITTTVGAPVTGRFSYDLTAPGSPWSPTVSSYSGGCWTLNVDGHVVTSDTPPLWYVEHDPGFQIDSFTWVDGVPSDSGTPITIDGTQQDQAYINCTFFLWLTNVLTDTSLPTPAELAQLPPDYFTLDAVQGFSSVGKVQFAPLTILGITQMTDACSSGPVSVDDASWGRIKAEYR